MAKKLEISKGTLLNKNPAVRMTQIETIIIN